MKKIHLRNTQTILYGIIAFFAAGFLTAGNAIAAGTPAGTVISNKATVNYVMNASSHTVNSNTSTIVVNEVLNTTMTWLDAAPGVTVTPGQTKRIATMKLTNTGNGSDTYTLSATSSQVTGTNFAPLPAAIYLDSNGNGIFDAGVDQLYDPNSNIPALGADKSLIIFIQSDIPSTGLVDGQMGSVSVNATSKTGTGSPGAVLSGKGPGGTDVVVGLSGGVSAAVGIYVVSSIAVNIGKTAAIVDQYGGNKPIVGATMHYTLRATVSGSGTATGVVITDVIPANTTYVPGTLTLNSVALTDALDADAGDVGGTAIGTVTVRLGNLTAASAAQIITFDVRIN